MSLPPLIIPIFIPHQGCPHRCTFCDQTAITEEVQSMNAVTAAAARIETYLGFAGPRRGSVQVAFYGGNFLGLERAAVKAHLDGLGPWLARGQIDGIRFSTRPDTITPERLGWIASYPVKTIELGVQSMNDDVLAECQRGHTAGDTRRAMARLRAAGYRAGIQLMLGLPGDSAQGALTSARIVAGLRPDMVRIYPTLVLAGSALARSFKTGQYRPLTLAEAVAQTKALLRLFNRQHIKVIRMGLQAADGLDDPAVVLAGPYHAAFGHMVYAGLYLDAARILLERAKPLPEAPILRVPPRELSRLQGLGKANRTTLRQRFQRPQLVFQADDRLPPETVACGEQSISVWQPEQADGNPAPILFNA
jgi:histone acetyltransferase (RNA polymerase elongator complex component)